MLCHITTECLSSENAKTADHYYVCSPVENGSISDFSYKIELPTAFLHEHMDEIMAGKLFARVPGGEAVNGKIVYPRYSEITIGKAPDNFHSRQRRLQVTGTRTLLVLRITANDASPFYSAQDIYGYVFDSSQPIQAPSLASQYSALSFGKLTFVPTQYGVLDVSVNMNANGATSDQIRDAAIAAVQSSFGVSTITAMADHVMFCIPPGTGSWSGNASINSWRTVFNDQWCGYLSGLMHEMGHNLGLLVSAHLVISDICRSCSELELFD